jgi:hypothetical protein
MVSLTTAGGTIRPVELMRMRMAAALVWTWALAELVCTRPKGGLCGGTDVNREDKM